MAHQAEGGRSIERACYVLLLACVPASMLVVGDWLPGAIRPLHLTYPKYFACQTLAALFALAAAALWIGRAGRAGRPAGARTSAVAFFAAVAAYAAWSGASCLWSPWPYGTRGYVIRELTFYVLCLGCFAVYGAPRRWLTFGGLFLLAAAGAALCQGGYLAAAWIRTGGRRPLWLLFHERPFLYGNRNFACATVVCAGLLAVGFAARRVWLGRCGAPARVPLPFYLGGCAVALLACAFIFAAAGSVAGYVAALVALVSYAICMLPIARRHFAAGAIVAGVLLGLLITLRVPSLQRRAMDGTLGRASTRQARALWWLAASDMLWQKPLHGWGTGAYGSAYYRFAPPLADQSPYTAWKQAEHPHNELLRVGAELGAVGLALYVAAIGIALAASYRALRRQDFAGRAVGFALWAASLGYIAQAALGKAAMYGDFALPHWMLLGTLGSASLWEEADAPAAQRAWRMTAARWAAWGVAAAAVAVLWWNWGLGSYRSMVHLARARTCLRAAERRIVPARTERRAPDRTLTRLLQRAEDSLGAAEPRCLWPTEVLLLRYSLGSVLASLGRCRDAVAHLEQVAKAAPGALRVDYLLGCCYLALGQPRMAHARLEGFIERHPTFTPAYRDLALLDRRTAARLLLEQVARDQFGDPARTALLGRMMVKLGLWEDVERLLGDTQRLGAGASLRALGRALEELCAGTARHERLEALRERFPGAFERKGPQ